MSKLCVVVPTYNEAENLAKLVTQIEKALHNLSFHLIIVDDNSPDNTAKVAEEMNEVYGNMIVKSRLRKSGLGSALHEGLRVALAMEDIERIVTLDADLSHNPSEIPKLLQAAQQTDIVQGSRYVEDGRILGWGPGRRMISSVANFICKMLLRTSLHDCTGNFRIYSRSCAETIVNFAAQKGFEWVVEAMFIARKRRFDVKEVPITFVDRKEGKTKLKALEIVNWGFFAVRSLFSLRPFLNAPVQSSRAIHRSSTFTVAVTAPAASTTK